MQTDKILEQAEKPARYSGHELNLNLKPDALVKYCLCFPDIYEIGMSHLGSAILYSLINERTDTSCERCYSPWIDLAQKLVEHNLPLFSLETRTPLEKFDILGISIGYELCYSNIVNMLHLAHIPVKACDRVNDNSYPLIIAGGGGIFNPEPVCEIFDAMLIGEGEEVTNDLLNLYSILKQQGIYSKQVFLEKASQIKGIYIPSFYAPVYKDGLFEKMITTNPQAPDKIEKRIINDLDKSFFPQKPLVPYLNIVHDRMVLELFRGCTRGCRFCQAGFIYRPVRERKLDTLLNQAEQLYLNTGCDEISLCSLSSGDYSEIYRLISELNFMFKPKNVSVALPSLRADSLTDEYAEVLKNVRKTGLTLAPEAGSQRLRDIINKNITEQDIIDNVTCAFKSGYDTIKLYFMIGLPKESYEDLDAICELAVKIRECYYALPKEQRKRPPMITISCSNFVPKAHTPFEFEPQDTQDVLKEKQKYLKDKLRQIRGVKFNYHDADVSFLEAVFARGDRRLLDVIIEAAKLGASFEGHSECFKLTTWLDAFENKNIDPKLYAHKRYKYTDSLPWEIISCGVSHKYLACEHSNALLGLTTHDCRENCNNCGMEGVCNI